MCECVFRRACLVSDAFVQQASRAGRSPAHTHTHTHRAEVKEPGASSGVRLSLLYTCSGLCNQRALTLPSWTL